MNSLELTIITCLIKKPELMKSHKLKDEYFKEYNQLWKFIRIFYQRYNNLDLVLMATVCKNKKQMCEYFDQICDVIAFPGRFETYQKQLIRQYEEQAEEKRKIEDIYEFATKLMVRDINLRDFKEKIMQICDSIK